MHQVLIEAARRKSARKRVTTAVPEPSPLPVEDALTVAMAIERLELENPAQARVLQCLILLGMTAEETATALGVSKRSVERHWHDARARLSLTLTSDAEPSHD
jgi:DNA-directed RNA polymerase specialized sigma24 family protein